MMQKDQEQISRREFIDLTAKAGVGVTAIAAAGVSDVARAADKKRIALVGTGIRGTTMWGSGVAKPYQDLVEFVGLCDINPKRVEAGKQLIGVNCATFTDFDRMIKETKPETVIVTTKDSTHDQFIIRAMELGCDVITEKPMTTDEKKCQAILDAEKKYGKKITVTFNYRYSAIAEKFKEILQSGEIGPVTSVDFHWYLDIQHGADYFRRWHAYKESSGSLWVHKATHHFDLINWALEADPVEVTAFGELKNYGRNGKLRGKNCRTCQHKTECKFYWDMTRNPVLMKLYAECESEDGYLRDACVYREDINIWDTMTANVKYSSGALMSYSLNTFMPYEGYHLAFNGMNGRVDVRAYERQPWTPPATAEIRVTKNFGKSELLEMKVGLGGHFGADPRLKDMIFKPGVPDPLKQRAGSRAGAMSLLTGVAAVKSIEQRKPIKIADLIRL
ncbi:MAG: Gfo/Idh/MocA family oxidoreductase [Acidobacteria bacterium]|nr:Gfo/Idh/MocA family oxidoreductase [Acidobacteriota bacterium]